MRKINVLLTLIIVFVSATQIFSQNSNMIKNTEEYLLQSYRNLVDTISKISEIYLYDARFDDALILLNSDYLNLIKNEIPSEDRIRIKIQQGKLMIYKSRFANTGFDTTLNFLHDIENAAKLLNNKKILAEIVDLIGWGIMYRELSNGKPYDPALKYFEQSLKLRREFNDKEKIAESLFHVGLVYEYKSNLTSAIHVISCY